MKVSLGRAKRALTKQVYQAYDSLFETDHYWNYRFQNSGFHQPNYTFDSNKIAFIHLPKTGGTTISKLLQQDTKQRFVNLDIHRPISSLCPPNSFSYVTIIRHPIDRVWSQYQMVLRSPSDYPYHREANKGLAYLLKHCWSVRNMACRYYTARVRHEPHGESIQLAYANLKKFKAVLDFAHFSTEVPAFLANYDLDHLVIPHERKSKYPSPSVEEQALIAKYNQYDIDLYEKWKTHGRTN
ncbi:MAG: sulfotransferase family 2 domain-containing protein [Bacteroidota bacterium]